MFCPKCGRKLPNGSKFCSGCGEKMSYNTESEVLKNDNAVNTATSTADTINEMPHTDAVNAETPVKQATAVTVAEEVETEKANTETVKPNETTYVKPKKKLNTKIIIIIIAAAIVAIIGVVFLISSIGSAFNKGNAYICLADGQYKLITNIKKGEAIDIASSKSAYDIPYSLLRFSPDEKYIYYYTKYDPSDNTGTLCKTEYGKLGKNPSRNSRYIEIIASNVQLGYTFLKNGDIIYKNGQDSLYYYDGKESTIIGKNVYYYFIDDNDSKLIYTSYNNDDKNSSLYGVKLNDISNKIKLASNFSNICQPYDLNNILYIKQEDDNSMTLYSVGFDKDPKKIAENSIIFSSSDGKTYFSAEDGNKLNLYDLLSDNSKEADSLLEQPDYDDFSVPNYYYQPINSNRAKESDYEQLYTSCVKDLYWYYNLSHYKYITMEEAVNYNWTDNEKEIQESAKNFIEKYGDSADENGYILVTPEIKEELKKMSDICYPEETSRKWLHFCFERFQSGTHIDSEAYENAYFEWDKADTRNQLREELNKPENQYPLKTIYCYDKGNIKTVAENVLNAQSYKGAVIYNTLDKFNKKIDINKVYSLSDIKNMLEVSLLEENNVLITETGAICKLSPEAIDSLAKSDGNYGIYDNLCFTKDSVYLIDETNALTKAPISEGIIKGFEFIADDSRILKIEDSKLYYVSGEYYSNDYSYGELNKYEGGKNISLAKDILPLQTKIYSDGVILAYTGARAFSGYELSMIKPNGEVTIIADNVTNYVRVNKSNILYVSDGDLYIYNGKKRQMVMTDANYVWSLKSMEISQSFEYLY